MPFPLPIWAQASIVGVVAIFAAFIGYRVGDARVDRVLNKINNHTLVQIEKAATITQDSGAHAAQVITKIRTVTETLHEEVPIYVHDAPGCVLSVGALRVLNASAEGVPVSEPPSESDDASSGIGCPEAVTNAVTNNGIAHEVSAQLTTLQDWIRQQQALAANGK